jgi:diguanylate cyclase
LLQFDSSLMAEGNRPASRIGDSDGMNTQESSGGVLDLSPIGRGRVYLWTALGTLGCMAVALAIDSFNFPNLTQPQLLRAIAMNTLLPLGLAGPILLFLLNKMRQLNLAQQHLAVLASTDSLTGLLNRHGFTSAVEDAMSAPGEPLQRGALLIADADNFKHINDRFGHTSGDSALQLLAATMLRMLRPEDRLGRIGGEEFAIYLPGLSALAAETVAERIRHAVAAAEFVPENTRETLTVSIGGAAFERPTSFAELFRLADKQLYRAKSEGRNRVAFATVAPAVALPAAA